MTEERRVLVSSILAIAKVASTVGLIVTVISMFSVFQRSRDSEHRLIRPSASPSAEPGEQPSADSR